MTEILKGTLLASSLRFCAVTTMVSIWVESLDVEALLLGLGELVGAAGVCCAPAVVAMSVEVAAITLAMRLVRRLIFLHLPLRMVVLLKQRSIARPKIENVFCCCRPVEIAASLDLMRQSGAAKQV
jgi:hypothetical protein